MHFETITKLLNLPKVIVVNVLDVNDGCLHICVASLTTLIRLFAQDAVVSIHQFTAEVRSGLKICHLTAAEFFSILKSVNVVVPTEVYIQSICRGYMVALPNVLQNK